MKTRLQLASVLGFLSAMTISSTASADQRLRVQVDQRGDFVLAGNTLGWDCAGRPDDAPLPFVGDVPVSITCGLNADDNSIDVYWRADATFPGTASANLLNTAGSARSTSLVDLPPNAEVTHAFLYWAARKDGPGADTGVLVERPSIFSQAVTAIASNVLTIGSSVVYQSVADVTSLVRANGRGVYRVSGVDALSLPSTYEDVLFAGWAMFVLYKLDSEPPRNLAIFDGLDDVDEGRPSSVKLSGFLVPSAGFDAKLGTIVYEGDDVNWGDSLLFGQEPLDDSDRLSDSLNPVDNFFNGTHSQLGQPVSHGGDLPQLNGMPRSMAGLDLDVVDVTGRLSAGQTSVDLRATSNRDHYFLGAFATSISTFRPDFSGSQKTVRDVNGGTLVRGDQLEYSITATNTGNDASTQTVLTDALPQGITPVPGSINIVSGDNAGSKTEAVDADQAAYDPATRTLTVHLGSGASANNGGSIAVGGSTVVTFLATVDPTASGVIANQAVITAAGARGAPSSSTRTDGNITVPGTSTTEIPVAGCVSNAGCGGGTPICDPSAVCVECNADAQCPGVASTCDLASHRCVCGGPAGSCMDTDSDGQSDSDETQHGTDPSDADSDDDGVPDGAEKTPFADTDRDGLINALDPDSDDDGLYDGTESGLGCGNPATKLAPKHCIPDADSTTQTDPNNADTDAGGALDGNEDGNRDGKLDPGERDPTASHGADDLPKVDSDTDGLSDAQEGALGSDPRDRDSDDDGLPDGEERNPADDSDGDGLINILDPDSDNDGLYDGTEAGKGCLDPDTKPGHCKPDADFGTTTSSPVVADSDGGGASDGSEDSNANGALDPDERDPTVGHASDDSEVADADGDGLSDTTEKALGSNPADADTDDDGVRDGDEANRADDTDRDGKINVLDPDSDNDGVGDGTERGSLCIDPATNIAAGQCVPDADGGTTTTFVVNDDTDHGGVPDGVEDTNHNGKIEPGEGDPNNARDDQPTPTLLDAGVPDAGETASGPVTTIMEPATAFDAGVDAGLQVTVTGGGCGLATHDQRTPWSTWLPLIALAALSLRRRARS
jgi:clumping factor A